VPDTAPSSRVGVLVTNKFERSLPAPMLGPMSQWRANVWFVCVPHLVLLSVKTFHFCHVVVDVDPSHTQLIHTTRWTCFFHIPNRSNILEFFFPNISNQSYKTWNYLLDTRITLQHINPHNVVLLVNTSWQRQKYDGTTKNYGLTNRDCKTGLADELVLPVLLPSGFYFEIQFFYLCKLIVISFRFNVFT
jgi:hypothetical protein